MSSKTWPHFWSEILNFWRRAESERSGRPNQRWGIFIGSGLPRGAEEKRRGEQIGKAISHLRLQIELRCVWRMPGPCAKMQSPSVKQYAQWWRLASYFISADKVPDQMALMVPGQSYLAKEIWAKGKICSLRHRPKRWSWLGFSSLSIFNRFECGARASWLLRAIYGHSTAVQFRSALNGQVFI